MPTDLSTVHDHPSCVLGRRADELAHRIDSGPAPEVIKRAAKHLLDYEREKGITFVALDDEALARVREAYEADLGGDLADAIHDLLGFDPDPGPEPQPEILQNVEEG